MPWHMDKGNVHEVATCSVIDNDSLNCRKREHHAVGQVKRVLDQIFLLCIPAVGVGFEKHRAESHRKHWLQR